MEILLKSFEEANCSKRSLFPRREKAVLPPRPQDWGSGFFFFSRLERRRDAGNDDDADPRARKERNGSSKEIQPMRDAKMMAEN